MLRYVVFSASLALGALSLFAILQELAPRVGDAKSQLETYQELATAPPASGLSLETRSLALIRCADALRSIAHRAQPTPTRKAVERNCEGFARSILRENPVNSLAWYLVGIVASERGDLDDFVSSLRMSQQTAPAEQWLARLRVELGEKMRSQVGEEALAFLDADLALMVQSSTGVAAIAQRYVAEPDFRERITEIVETLPEADQARFVGWVANAVRSRGA